MMPLESGLGDLRPDRRSTVSRWMGWRLRMLVLAALAGCIGVLLLSAGLASVLRVPGEWRANLHGEIELVSSSDAELKPQIGRMLEGLRAGDQEFSTRDLLLLQQSRRWIVTDAQRQRQVELSEQLRPSGGQDSLVLRFTDGKSVRVQAQAGGFGGLPLAFWLLSAAALALYLIAMVVYLARPTRRNLLYAVMSVCQAGTLVLMAIQSTAAMGQALPFPALDLTLRMGLDFVTGAAMIHAACLHPKHLPNARSIAGLGWAASLGLLALAMLGWLPQLWWWLQGAVAATALSVVALHTWSYQIEPRPFALVLKRFGLGVFAAWLLLSSSLVFTLDMPGMHHLLATAVPKVWYLLIAGVLVLLPFLSKSEAVLREFAFLAAMSTVATVLDLIFVAFFSLSQFASLSLALFLSLAAYSGVREWLLGRLFGSSVVTTERLFEQVYRIAREVEAHPERTTTLMCELLRELFEPMELTLIEMRSAASRVTGDGSTMLVPVPVLSDEVIDHGESIVIRFAQHGRRLFTSEDSRLTDRIVEQLRRAVAYDRAVERGRGEERLRLAQDLHDDIGARLLTLMYKAQSPEMEDYVRHTLQDLKTLTRGLAAPHHRMSHAAAEWKSDLTQRLHAARIELSWSCEFDDDVLLTVTQWSALTRVMRELVSNAIAHSQAQRVDIDLRLDNGRLHLIVSDNGVGRDPKTWAHGLGLGGVRKRVKQLGGEVEWRDFYPHGISCSVFVRQFTATS
jgi:signal transduction histidine kinase